jgi:ABC-type transporter Mla MlaB component
MQCTLTGDLTIAAAADARMKLLQALAGDGPLELDTSQVTEIDAAGLQVVLAALRSAARAKIPIRFPPNLYGPVVGAGLRMVGLAKLDWNQEDFNHA